MAGKITYRGNSVAVPSEYVGLTFGEFMESDTYENIRNLFDVPEDSTLEVKDGNVWNAPLDDDEISDDMNMRFTVVGGGKG